MTTEIYPMRTENSGPAPTKCRLNLPQRVLYPLESTVVTRLKHHIADTVCHTKAILLSSIVDCSSVFALALVACGGQADSTDVASSTINLNELPQEVDVQTVFEIQGQEDVYVLDVREQYEYDEKHIPNVTLLPMSEIENRLNEIPKDKEAMFNLFASFRESTSSGKKRGYGLYVARLITEHNNGSIKAFDLEQAIGAKFVVVLPSNS